jgi:hypothetical protein
MRGWEQWYAKAKDAQNKWKAVRLFGNIWHLKRLLFVVILWHLSSSSIASAEPLSCPAHSYNVHILSHEPSIIYIENFLSADESANLLKIPSEDQVQYADAKCERGGTEFLRVEMLDLSKGG